MKIRLVSRDRQVEMLCREGLARLCGPDGSLFLDPEGQLDTAVDLEIFDLDDAPSAPAALWDGNQLDGNQLDGNQRNAPTRILLYNQEQLEAMPAGLPAAMALLKPLRPEVFLTVLGCAVARRRSLPRGEAAVEGAFDPREELLQCLLYAGLELQRSYARQMHFLARGLHDLRAPLTAVEGYGGLLLAERFGPLTGAQRENLQRMQHSVTRLTRMTTDIFRLSLGERGEQTPDLQPADMEYCIQHVLDEMMPLADGKQVRLASEVAAPAETLCFDDEQIHSVLTNLLENACRFTPRNGSIEVRGYSVFWERRGLDVRGPSQAERRQRPSPDLNAYRVDIRDCGPGVPAAHLQSIFEPYASYAGSQDRAGSGLGLAICRMVIGAHRGRIFAESGEDGAVFSFVLPFAEPSTRSPRRPLRAEQEAAGWPGRIAEETA
jgi:signal transduction histidine kinase